MTLLIVLLLLALVIGNGSWKVFTNLLQLGFGIIMLLIGLVILLG